MLMLMLVLIPYLRIQSRPSDEARLGGNGASAPEGTVLTSVMWRRQGANLFFPSCQKTLPRKEESGRQCAAGRAALHVMYDFVQLQLTAEVR